MIDQISIHSLTATIVIQTQPPYFLLFALLFHRFIFSWPLLNVCPVLCFLFQGWTFKRNDGQVASLEGITVNPERKIKEKWQQSGEGQETDKSPQKQRGLDKPGSCHPQYNQENYRDNTANNMSSDNNVFDLATACSTLKNKNLNSEGTLLSSTRL